MKSSIDPHADQPLAVLGPSPTETGRVLVMIHGRNATARNILDLVPRLNRPLFSYLAPAAANNSWYPLSFLAERSANEPHLSSAIKRLDRIVNDVSEIGISKDRVVLLGF